MNKRIKLVNGENSIVVWQDEMESLLKKGWTEDKPKVSKKKKAVEIIEINEEGEV
jgi:hypothetical protein